MTELCIFDLDGTLLNTLGGIRYFLNLTLDRYGIPPLDEERVREFVGNGASRLVERALRYSGIDTATERGGRLFAEVLREYVALYDSDPNYLTTVYDGIGDLLAALKARGVKLAILSNKPDSTVVPLASLYFGNTFSYVSGAREGIALKPAPDAALRICAELGVDAKNTVYIGDSEVDIRTAKAYGAGCAVGVLWGFRSREKLVAEGADVIAATPADILTALNTK